MPAVSGALVALDPNDGAIVSLVGGFDFGAASTTAWSRRRRQPGSSFKPFLYSAALEKGFTPATLVNDAPIVLPGGDGAEGDEEWRPQNITKRFYGPTPMREGLVRSRNLVSIRLLRGTGIGYAMKHIASFGFGPESLPAEPDARARHGTGHAARHGAWLCGLRERRIPRDAVLHPVGTGLPPAGRYSRPSRPACVRVSPRPCAAGAVAADSPPDAATASANVTPGAAADPGRPARAAGDQPGQCVRDDGHDDDVIQRGTASARVARPAWTSPARPARPATGATRGSCGFNADIAAAVWIGFDQERSLGENEEGGKTALPMWIYFMEEALRDKPPHRQPEPPGVVRMWVSRESGAPARAGAPGALFEAFLEQYAPQPGSMEYSDEGGRRDGTTGQRRRLACILKGLGMLAMSRRPNPRAELLRLAVAEEAARIMGEQGVDDFLQAKRKAAERLGVTTRRSCRATPRSKRRCVARQRLFSAERHEAEIAALRRSALEAMRLMADFDPRLVGPVLAGTASAHSEIHLHLFSESAEAVSLRLEERGVPHEVQERRVRFERDRLVSYPALRFVAGRQPVDAVVFPLDGIRQSPCSPVDGKPMRRASTPRSNSCFKRCRV